MPELVSNSSLVLLAFCRSKIICVNCGVAEAAPCTESIVAWICLVKAGKPAAVCCAVAPIAAIALLYFTKAADAMSASVAMPNCSLTDSVLEFIACCAAMAPAAKAY